MLRRRHPLSLALLLVALAAVIAACGGGDDTTTEAAGGDATGGSFSGTILLDGSSTVAPLSEAAAELFMNANPDARVTVATSGTGGGFEKFCNGETDGNDASRKIKESEIEACEANGIKYDNIVAANDALSVVVNNDNPVQCMTIDQLRQVWDADSSVKTFGDVQGLDAGAFAGEAVVLYGPGTDSGTFDFFTEVVNGEEGRIRTDYTDIGEDDNAAVVGVAGSKGGMAFIPYSYYQEKQGEVRALQIDGGNGCVDATLENVQSGAYAPLGRELYVYASDTALQRPEVVGFFTFYIENNDQIATAAGVIPLTAEQRSEQIAKVQSLAG